MDTITFLHQLEKAPWYKNQIAHTQLIPQRQASFGELEEPLHPLLQSSLEHQGLWPLYSHQAEAINALRRGHNIMVATPAASGKSLCYHLPVLNDLVKDRLARALYVYPTKALAQDQLKKLEELGKHLPLHAAIFDGDTPREQRAAIKGWVQILLTNPDMLHLGIMPNHKTWSRLFQGLRYIVLDEAHVYRGIFGSHVANVLRRLRRICRFYGSSPQFILCSATIANPGEHANRLTGIPFRVIEKDGSPYGGKRFVFWNPPVMDKAKANRRSANIEAAAIFAELVSRSIRTITFVRSRKVAELVYLYTREQLARSRPELARRISPYRATYLPEDRRHIEKGLFNGSLIGTVSTNALELGIDIGTLDATVITGYPGSISSTWQQAGRSGRRREESLSILVGQDNPLDQYFMRHPETFFGKPVENALISPENPYIIKPHLLCAAYEAPLTSQDEEFFGPSLEEHLQSLQAEGLIRNTGGRWYLTPKVFYPAEMVNIRSTSPHNYLVVEESSGAILETIEEAAAFYQLHPGAVYLHGGEPYLILRLDLESRTAYARLTDMSYYTQAKDVTDIRILRCRNSKMAGRVKVYLGEVEVTNQVLGFKKKAPFTEEVLSEEYLSLPPRRFNTVALWFHVPEHILDTILKKHLDLAGGLHGTEHAAIGVLPLFALCDRNDIGGVSTPVHSDTGQPTIFIYDGHPGGIGIAERGYQLIQELWQATLHVVSECQCSGGCPSCVQSPKCGNNNQPLDKEVAITILKALCEG